MDRKLKLYFFTVLVCLALQFACTAAVNTLGGKKLLVDDSFIVKFTSLDSVSTASGLSVQGVSDVTQWNSNVKSWLDTFLQQQTKPLRRLIKRSGTNVTDSPLSRSYLQFGSNLWGAHLSLSSHVLGEGNSELLNKSRVTLQNLVSQMKVASSSSANKSSISVQMNQYVDAVEQDHYVYVSSPYFRGSPESRRLNRRSDVSSSATLTPNDVINFTTVSVSSPPGWGLDRISEKSLTLDNKYQYPNTSGVGVIAYVIDTGVEVNNPEFENRATWGTNTYSESSTSNTDDNGHGTFVAGIIAGRYVGVARNASIIAVKSLGADGSGRASDVLSGLTWVVNDWTSKGKPKVIINMSLGTSYSSSINAAVAAAVKQGVPITVAAGNDGDNACDYSPSSESSVITIGATTKSDSLASFSNYGSCVTALAPGADVYSLSRGSSGSTSSAVGATTGATYDVESGTSFASPYVAGVIALILSTLVSNNAPSPAFVKNCVTGLAVTNQISGVKGSPNLLTYTGFTATGVVNQNFASKRGTYLLSSLAVVGLSMLVLSGF